MSLLRHSDIPELSQDVFDAIVDPTRRTILELLASKGQMSATEIYDNFDMSNPAVSQHLRILRKADLVRIERDAQKHLYSLKTKTMHQLEKWIKQTAEHWDQRFARLDSLLEAEKKNSKRRR